MVTVSTEVAGTPKYRPRVGSATLTIVASRIAMNITPTYTALTATRGLIRPPRPALPCPGTRSMQSRRHRPRAGHRAVVRPLSQSRTPALALRPWPAGRTVVWTTSYAQRRRPHDRAGLPHRDRQPDRPGIHDPDHRRNGPGHRPAADPP